MLLSPQIAKLVKELARKFDAYNKSNPDKRLKDIPNILAYSKSNRQDWLEQVKDFYLTSGLDKQNIFEQLQRHKEYFYGVATLIDYFQNSLFEIRVDKPTDNPQLTSKNNVRTSY